MVLSMNRWHGKVAVVTGASAGIGMAIVEQLVEAGLKVAGFARRSDRIEANAKKLSSKKGQLYAVKVDLSNEASIIAGFKWVEDNLGTVAILVNNAGVIQDTELIDGDSDMWRNILDTNVLGLCIATREAIRSMKKGGIDGHVVHINSLAGHSVPDYRGFNVYPASKYAVTALTETLRQELVREKSKIKVTSVSPGLTRTEIADNHGAIGNVMKSSAPAVLPEDIADAVSYVLSTPPHVQVHELLVRPTCDG